MIVITGESGRLRSSWASIPDDKKMTLTFGDRWPLFAYSMWTRSPYNSERGKSGKGKVVKCESHVWATGGKRRERQAIKGINTKQMRVNTGLFNLRDCVSTMFRLFVTFVIFGVICTHTYGQQTGEESCETLPFQLHLIKGFYCSITLKNVSIIPNWF